MTKLLTILFIALLPHFVSAQTTYHVASDGSGDFTTIAQVNAATFSPGDNVLFKRGDTFYGALVVSQSGTSGLPITYGAYGTGAKPVISGMQSVTSWTNTGGNIWQSTSAVSTLSNVKQVVINNVTIPMGATPNRDAAYPYLPNYYPYQSHTGTGLGTTSLTSSSLDGTNWTGADVVVRSNHWTMDKESITASSGTTITYSGQSDGTDGGGLVNGWGFFIQNDIRTLDQQNEWYYNPSTKKLSIYSTTTPTGVSVTNVDTVFYVRNKNYIQVDSIDFEGANTSALVISSSHHCIVTYCDVRYTGETALSANNTSNYLTVDNCNLSDVGSAAIWNNDGGTDWIITNNTITRQGLVSVTRANDYSYGAINIFSPNAFIQYNHIDSTAYEGIHFRPGGVQVRNNLVMNCGFLRDDGGLIYTGFGNELGKIIDGNIVINSIGNGRGVLGGATASNGIYADGLTDGATLTNNTIANIRNSGMFLNNDTAMLVRGNTIFNCGKGSDFTKGNLMVQTYNGSPYAGYQRNNRVTNNIFFQKRAEQYNIFFYESTDGTNTAQNFGVLDSNLYIKASDNNVAYYDRYDTASTAMTFSRWKTTSSQEANGTAYAGNGSIDTNNVILVYNPTKVDSVVSLGAIYKDFKGVTYTNTITLSPYRSALLIYDSPGIAAPSVTTSGDQTIITNSTTVFSTPVAASGETITGILWTDVTGSGSATITSPTSQNTGITGLSVGTHTFRVTVTQSDGQTAHADVNITLTAAPTINAGSNQTIIVNNTSVTATVTWASGHSGTVAWTQTSGTTAAITNPTSTTTTITGIARGTSVFKVTGTQDDTQTANSSVTIVYTAAPTANAGVDQTITLPASSVTLSGSGTVASGQTATYEWTKISGAGTQTITGNTTLTPVISGMTTAGDYVFQLKVTQTDTQFALSTVTVHVNAAPTPTQRPFINLRKPTIVIQIH